MGSVVALRPRAKEELTSSLGMLIALGSWAMMFGALFFTYAGVRSRAVTWPPPGVPHLPVALPALNTVVLLASSVAMSMGIRALSRGKRKAIVPALSAAAILGAVFLALQFVVWKDLWQKGLLPSTGVFGSVFYGLTALHAVHVAAGLVLLLVLLGRALGGAYTEHTVSKVRVPVMFWHFVDAVWLLMFFAVYLF
jgi:cytochrome c oxidase subunit 3